MTDMDASSQTAFGLESEIGRRVAKLRLARNITQQALAGEAGIGVRTIRRLEAGQATSLDSFLRVIIALGLGDDLLGVLPSYEIHPIERVDTRGVERRRARGKKTHHTGAPWTWGEETRD